MIDNKAFTELMNRGIITNVGLNPADYKDVDDLQRHGLATTIGADEEYAEIVKTMVNKEEVLTNFLAALKAGGNVTVPMDIVLTDYIEIKNEVVLDLNGCTIVHPATSASQYPDVFEVMTGGKLTIVGDGKVVAENGYSIYAAGDAVVEINGGEYFSPVTTVDARKNAHVTINAGTFVVDGTNNPDGDFGQKYTLNLRDKKGNYVADQSEITVKGGKFYKYNPAASESESPVANFVAEGYESVANGDWFVVSEVPAIVVDDNE
jgi:hypothetical protein